MDNHMLILLAVMVGVLLVVQLMRNLGFRIAFTLRSRLSNKLRAVWDGAGITSVERVWTGDSSGGVRPDHRRPTIIAAKKVSNAYYWFTVRPNAGRSVEDLIQNADAIRDALRATEVKTEVLGKGRVKFHVYSSPGFHEAFSFGDFQDLVSRANVDKRLPVGLSDAGDVVLVNLGHTLVVGATGSGKGSVIWSLIAGVKTQFQGAQVATFYGVDPKHAELATVEGLFAKVAFDLVPIAELLEGVVLEMKERQSYGYRNFEQLGLGPIVVVVDELPSLFASTDTKLVKRINESLKQLLTQGRSSGVYVFASTQQPQKDAMGNIVRGQFQNRICLRVETPLEVNLTLGDGAVDSGVKIHQLMPATESNGYATAGVGYVNTDIDSAPVRFRAPYVSDWDIECIAGGDSGKGGRTMTESPVSWDYESYAPVLTSKETALLLRVSESTLATWRKQKRPPIKPMLAAGHVVRYSRDEVFRLISGRGGRR